MDSNPFFFFFSWFQSPYIFLPLANTLSFLHLHCGSDLLDSKAISPSLDHTCVALRCGFKFHVYNSKWHRDEKLRIFPPRSFPFQQRGRILFAKEMQLPNKLCVTRKLLCQAISTESQNILTYPIYISWWLAIYCWPNPAVHDGSIFILIRDSC